MQEERYTEFRTDLSRPTYLFSPDTGDITAWNEAADRLHSDDSLDAVMKELAVIVADYEKYRTNKFQRECMKKALHWLESLRQRLEKANRSYNAVHLMEVTAVMASSDGEPIEGTERPEVFAWNEKSIGDGDAEKLIRSGMGEYSDKIVKMTPGQAASLFPDRKFVEDREEKEDG